MNKEKVKSLSVIGIVIIIFVIIPYFWRKYRDADIEKNKGYAFGKIIKKTGSLKNGHHWHYEFIYKNKPYEDYRPTHVDYQVHIGDYFLIEFSKKQPNHSKIMYEYKLRNYKPFILDQVWDTIPFSLLAE